MHAPDGREGIRGFRLTFRFSRAGIWPMKSARAGRCGGIGLSHRFGARLFLGRFMANGYMPRKDADAVIWIRCFSAGLSDRPATYHVSPSESDVVADAYQRFADAYANVATPQTRIRSAVEEKDATRAQAERTCRPFYARIKSDPSIPDPDKILIGVRPINNHRTRIGPPTTRPLLSIQNVTLNIHTLSVRDSDTPSRMHKAPGAVQVQLFGAIGDGAPPRFIGSYSRTPITITYSPADNGKTVTYSARWINRRGETGPWSQPVVAPIVAVAPDFAKRAA